MITIGEISVDFLDVASREIAADIPVIPVQPGQKQPPLISGGTTSASTEPQQIEEWAKLFPDANVGVVCTLTGILIVDDDEGVVEQSGIPLNTRIVESSPGHRQYYFRHTAASEEVGNIPQRAGFSLRSHNYYGLAAGFAASRWACLQDAGRCADPAYANRVAAFPAGEVCDREGSHLGRFHDSALGSLGAKAWAGRRPQ